MENAQKKRRLTLSKINNYPNYEFARKIFQYAGKKANLNIAAPDEFPSKVPRPKYSVLENSNLEKLGLNSMPDWSESLQRYMKSLP